MKIRIRILGPFILAMAALVVIVLAGIGRMSDAIIAENLAHEVDNGHRVIDDTTRSVSAHLQSLIYAVAANPEFARAMDAGDRERLYRLAKPYLDRWQPVSGVTHFYFHTPDGRNFLRVHMKDKFGDPISRRSLRLAMSGNAAGMATEIGMTGEWVRRVVMPWRDGDRLVGYIELGVDMERVYAAATRNLATTTLILLDKKRIPAPEIWESRRLQLGLSPYPWNALAEHVVVIHAGRPFDLAGLRQLRLDAAYDDWYRELGGQDLVAHVHPLRDEDTNRIVGAEIQLLDPANIKAVAGESARLVVGIVMLLLLAVIAALFGFLGRIQGRIDSEGARLQHSLDEKTRELREYQAHLEDRVTQRTRDLRHAQAVAHVGSWTLDIVSARLEWSEETYRIFALPPETPITLDVFVASLHPDDRDRILAAWSAALAGTPYDIEHRILAGGSVRWVRERAEIRFSPEGQALFGIGTVQDITEKVALIEELLQHRQHLEELVQQRTRQLAQAKTAAEAANLAKSAFLANMSHEIRTPLNAITGMAHLIRRAGVDAQQAERLDKLEAASAHLLEVINAILDLSKIEAGKFELAETEFNLAGLVDNVVSMVQERVRAKGLELRVECAPAALSGDPTRLRQALLNYLGNAVKFTERGRIALRAGIEAEGDGTALVRFEVEDTGIGIAPETLARLFTAFEQADATATRKYGGTGLGLAITRKLAELMGGSAGVDSRPGVGSTFWFTVRLRKGRQAGGTAHGAAGTEAEALLAGRHRGRRILLVDDEPINREVALGLMEDVGLAVDSAGDGEEAVALAQAGEYDLILMDMQMPRLDGLAATRRIRAQAHGAGVPILALTANAFADDRARCLDAGMNGYIAKPLEPDSFFATLLEWLDKS